MKCRVLFGCATVMCALLVSTTSAYAGKLFVPENGNVTGSGGEAQIFSKQITCAKNKFSGKIKKILGISKIEGETEFEECKFGALKVTNFTSPALGLNINETVSFRETEIKIEGGCVVKILAGGLNLLLKMATYKNEAVKKVKATINVEVKEENGLIYETNNTNCGSLAEKEKTRTSYTGTETIEGAEIVEVKEVPILPGTKESWTGTSGKNVLEILPGGATHEISCKETTSEGSIEELESSGPFHIDSKGCKAAGLLACTGLGEAKEVVLLLGTYHIVFDKLGTGSELGVGILFLIEPVHFECSGKLFIAEGEILCLIKPIDTLTKHFEIECQETKGAPGETTYWNAKGEEVKMGENQLLTKENEGTGTMSGDSIVALILTTKEFEIMG
jgi:hypothetical protein